MAEGVSYTEAVLLQGAARKLESEGIRLPDLLPVSHVKEFALYPKSHGQLGKVLS